MVMPLKDVLVALFVAVSWAFNLVVIKLAIANISPLSFGFLRFIFVAFPLVFFVKRPNIPILKLVTLGLVLGVAKFALLFKGLEQGVSVGISSLILQTQVLFTALISFIVFGYKLTKKEMLGIGISFIGIMLFASKSYENASFFGFLLILTSAFVWGISNNLSKTLQGVNMLSLTIWMSLVPPIPYFLLSQTWEGSEVFWQSMQAITLKELSATAYISYIATLFGLSGWTWLMRKHNPAKVSIYGLLIPVFSIFFGWIFFNETLSTLDFFACTLVFSGLLVNQFSKKISVVEPTQENINEVKILQNKVEIRKAS